MSAVFKRTKILATLGPPTSSPEMIETLIRSGANGFRLNFSHGDYSERDEQIQWIREASERVGKSVAILQDLQGPKIRLGMLQNNVDVQAGDEIVLDFAAEHDGDKVLPVQYNLAEKVKVGQPIYIFDGKIRTLVVAIESETAIRLRVENSGTLMSRKGINLPETDFGGDILTPKDLKDIEYGAGKDIDYVALSFVQTAEDIHNLRQILLSHGSTAQIVAKIETKAAIDENNLEEIVQATDGIMVARGDLAVEAGAEIVPIVQRKLVALSRKYGKFVIVATQVLGSMVSNPDPTRAEVGDVANAVIQGADTVMLSDETAGGEYPVEAVQAMRRVIIYTQEHAKVNPINDLIVDHAQRDAISTAAVVLAEQISADAIIAETKSGATAANIAAHRPNLPIISVTSEPRAAHQLALSYANRSYVRPDGQDAGLNLAKELQADNYFGTHPATVVIVSGDVPGEIGGTNRIQVYTLN